MRNRNFAIVLVSLGLFIGAFAGCSAEDVDSQINPSVVKEFTTANISKKWRAVHFNFSPIAQEFKAEKFILQKSLFQINLLDNGRLEAVNLYDSQSYKGTYSLESGIIVVELSDQQNYTFKIVDLQKSNMIVVPLDDSIVESIELVVY